MRQGNCSQGRTGKEPRKGSPQGEDELQAGTVPLVCHA